MQVQVMSGPERRRRWTAEQKSAVVAAAFAPGAVVAEVARRAEICAGQIYRWRRELGVSAFGLSEVIVDCDRDGAGEAGAAVPVIEVELCGQARLRIPGTTAPELAVAVIAAVMRPPVCRSLGEDR